MKECPGISSRLAKVSPKVTKIKSDKDKSLRRPEVGPHCALKKWQLNRNKVLTSAPKRERASAQVPSSAALKSHLDPAELLASELVLRDAEEA